MSKNYRKNHFVPQGYLKGFTNQNDKLFRLKLNPKELYSGKFEKTIVEKPVSSLCYKDDLYTIFDNFINRQLRISDNYPDKDKFIEKECFKNIENVIGGVIESIENGHMTDYEKSVLSDFIYLSIIRSPKVIEEFKSFYNKKFINEMLSEVKEDIENNGILEKMNMTSNEAMQQARKMIRDAERFKPENIGKIIIQNNVLNFHLNSNNKKEIFDLNKTRRFSIYKTNGNTEFITSNYPAFFTEDNLKNHGIYRLSFFLPLSKKNLLIIDGGNKSNYTEHYLNDNIVDSFNYLILKNSHGDVYGCCRKTLERYENKDFQYLQELKLKRASKVAFRGM